MSQPQSPSSKPHQSSVQQSPFAHQYYYQPPQSDEIDLRELFVALWKGKWIIIACTFLFTALAITYALLAKEQWSSTAKIAQPQVSDYSEYQNQVVQFQPIYDVYQEDGTVLVSEKLDDLVDSEKLYDLFLDEFNSSSNKRVFLETSEIFQLEKAKLDDPDDEDSLRKLYNDWYQLLTITPEDAKNVDGPYILTGSAETSEQSLEMLNNYIAFVDNKVHMKALSNLSAMIHSKKNEIKQQAVMLSQQAKQRLLVEKERAEYALHIAEAAGVSKPLQNFGENEIFAINLGADALKAKVQALEKVKNLSVIEPRLEQLSSKLELLENLNIDKSIKFSAYRYLDLPEREISKDKPRRLIISVVGLLFGAMIGIGIVFVSFSLKRKDEE